MLLVLREANWDLGAPRGPGTYIWEAGDGLSTQWEDLELESSCVFLLRISHVGGASPSGPGFPLDLSIRY